VATHFSKKETVFMKVNKINTRISGAFTIILCGTFPLFGQHAATNDVNSPRSDYKYNQDVLPPLGQLEKASHIIGLEVTDAQNQRLGRVKDLALDLQNGRLVEVIVGTGGILGFDEHFTAVPPDQFSCDAQKSALQLNTDGGKFKAAPIFALADWDLNLQPAKISDSYNYYGARPYFTSPGQESPKANIKPVHLGEVQRAGKLIGTDVRNLQDQKIGQVENLMIDFPAGRVAEVVLSSGGFLGIDSELSAVPPQSFRAGTNNLGTLVLDTSKDALSSAPHFKSSEWGNVNDWQHVEVVYNNYKIEPYFSTNAADNTAQNFRDRNDETLTPIRQGTSQSDIETTQRIRKALVATENLSVDARNIKVITVNGRVTLRGPVKSEDEKRRIEQIAESITPAANIDNQLQVAASPTASAQ
jgi:sporulation protein YlmC with PRC-barrel domain